MSGKPVIEYAFEDGTLCCFCLQPLTREDRCIVVIHEDDDMQSCFAAHELCLIQNQDADRSLDPGTVKTLPYKTIKKVKAV